MGAEPPELPPQEEEHRLPDIENNRQRASGRAAECREKICEYVNGPGAVSWQYRMANVPEPEAT